MITQINNKLKEMFDTLKGTNKPFVAVYDYHTLENDGYPYLCFELQGFDAEVLDTCNNTVSYNYRILIFQEVTKAGWRKEAKDIIDKAIEDVKDLLHKNYTLDWLVNFANPVSATVTPFVINNWKALVCDMNINIRSIEFIN